MNSITRRRFLQYCGSLAAAMGLSSSAVSALAQGMSQMFEGRAPILWLQGQSCSGCSVSLLNANDPGIAQILTNYISLSFHATVSAATGSDCLKTINSVIESGKYLMVVEGSIPSRLPHACMVGGEVLTAQVARAAKKAKAAIALGSCACYGGIPAAENNPTGAVGLSSFLQSEQIGTPVIAIPGCPSHPDWLIGTLLYTLRFGLPKVDEFNRPSMFFGKVLHDQCPRFADYEREKFATSFSEDGCLFRLGCMGPNTHTDCSQRLWNSRTNYCIQAGAPCIGCTMPAFASKASFPFYRKRELLSPPVKEG